MKNPNKAVLFLYLIGMLTAHISWGDSLCNSSQIIRMKRPFYPGVSGSPEFEYSFRYIQRNVRVDSPTVVFFPGGPGETSMSGDGSEYPKGLNVILTDPRGVGCNSIPGGQIPPDRFFSTSNIASDILSLINHLGLKSYVLHGASYGTLLATTVAYRAFSGEAQMPDALLLEGILGRAFRGDEVVQPIREQWSKTKLALTTDILKKLIQIDEKNTLLDFNEKQWGTFVSFMLYSGESALASMLVPLSDKASEKEREDLKISIKYILKAAENTSGELSRKKLHQQISCREITDFDPEGLSLVHGELVPYGKNDCEGIPLSIAFDSAKLQMPIPTIYIQGDSDRATPLWQAKYHFKNQILSKRFFITAKNSGHVVFGSKFADCSPAIWSEIIRGTFRIEDALRTCINPSSLDVAYPESGGSNEFQIN